MKANEKLAFMGFSYFHHVTHKQTILSYFIPVFAHDNTNSVKNTLYSKNNEEKVLYFQDKVLILHPK